MLSEKKSKSMHLSGNDAIRKKLPLQKPMKKSNNELFILRIHIASRVNTFFPNKWSLSHPNLTKNMKTYMRC